MVNNPGSITLVALLYYIGDYILLLVGVISDF